MNYGDMTIWALKQERAAIDAELEKRGEPLATINAAQIIGWARMVRNASPGARWTDTEIKLANVIAEVASSDPEHPWRTGKPLL